MPSRIALVRFSTRRSANFHLRLDTSGSQVMHSHQVRASLFLALLTVSILPTLARAEHEGKVQVLLLGDSTTIGSVCRRVEPKGLNLEDVIRSLLASEQDLPPVNVINQGR